MKRLSILGAAAALLLTTATVLATPGSGITALDTRGTSAAAYTITTEANREIVTQTLTFAAGGTSTSGWHTHPGPVVTIVQSGTMKIWFSSDCTLRTLTAGQAIVVPGTPVSGTPVFDLARNDDPLVPLVLVQTYYNVPVGGALRTDAPAPQCQTGPSPAPADMAVVGITAVNHSRVRLATALSITGAANTDLLIQQLTFAAGATTGWHRHPGALTLAVDSGELLFTHADCSTTAYPAGTAQFDPGVVHFASSAGASSVFVTYTNLPIGGAARIDEPAPACTAAPAATAVPAPAARPAPALLPNTSSEVVTGAAEGTGLLALTVMVAIGWAGLRVWRRRRA